MDANHTLEATKLVDLICMECGKPFKGPEPKTCCSGRDCGCMGMPSEPIACSDECYYLILNKYKGS